MKVPMNDSDINVREYFKSFEELKLACLNPGISGFSLSDIVELMQYENDEEAFLYKLLSIIQKKIK